MNGISDQVIDFFIRLVLSPNINNKNTSIFSVLIVLFQNMSCVQNGTIMQRNVATECISICSPNCDII